MPRRFDLKIYRIPIRIAILYSLLTVLLYVFGPYSYPNHNRLTLYVFLFVCNLGMWLGFVLGTNKPVRANVSCAHTISIVRLLNSLFWISLIVCIPKFMMSTGIYSNIFSNIIFRVTMYSEMAREFYLDRQVLTNVTGIWKVINIIVVLLGPFYWAYLSLSMLFWSKLSVFKKCFTVLIYIIYIGQYLCTGTNVGVFNFIVLLGVVFLIRRHQILVHNRKKSSRQKVLVIVTVLIVSAAFLSFFNITMGSRSGAAYELESSSHVCNEKCPVNHKSVLYKITPETMRPLLLTTTTYVAKPYGALSFAFDMDFQPTFGVGYSWFLLDNAPASSFLWDRTYPKQLEKTYQYSSWINWHTAYTWFANDVSWFGVPVVMFFLFWIFGHSWKRFVMTGDLLDFLMFMLFVRFILFISMNNQVFQQSDSLFAFWGILFLKWFTKPIEWKA